MPFSYNFLHFTLSCLPLTHRPSSGEAKWRKRLFFRQNGSCWRWLVDLRFFQGKEDMHRATKRASCCTAAASSLTGVVCHSCVQVTKTGIVFHQFFGSRGFSDGKSPFLRFAGPHNIHESNELRYFSQRARIRVVGRLRLHAHRLATFRLVSRRRAISSFKRKTESPPCRTELHGRKGAT